MSFWNMLETLLLGPLKLVFEVIFQIANRFIGHPGLAIIVLSLIMNVLVLPLYKRADAMQEASRDMEAKLKKGVDHIKKHFTGDERMMLLQTYYRQNNYKPTQALNGSVSLLLEIPFFMAAYRFLSQLEVVQGVSLGPIADLGQPDGMLVIGGVAINLLPVLMTLVNVISAAIYLKGFPLKTKIQLYGMAGFFLVFLYTSPSCLVFYWTLNNVFSLVKTIFYKLKDPKKVLRLLLCAVGILLLGCGIFLPLSSKRRLFLLGVGLAMQLPALWKLMGATLPKQKSNPLPKPDKVLFLLGCVFLTGLVGGLIPSAFLAASPQEYVDLTYYHNPLWYIISSCLMAAGTFLVWLGVFYWLASPRGKVIFERVVWVLSGVMLVNYMCFGTDLGMISASLQYLEPISFSVVEQVLNLLVIAAVGTFLYLLVCRFKKAAVLVLLTAILAIGGMTGLNTLQIKKSVDEVFAANVDTADAFPSIQLSKTGKNVIIFMLDRGMGSQVPYILNEKPQLKESFDGFTWYANTVAFGGHTNFCAPPLYGGYEYTPVEMNKRDEELLMLKHNEPLFVLPRLFVERGYRLTLCDPVYVNYQWIGDLSAFDSFWNTKAYHAEGRFGDPVQKQVNVQNTQRNFFCLSVMKTMPLVLQPTLYNEGRYNQAPRESTDDYAGQVMTGLTRAEGLNADFMDPYNMLCELPRITEISEDGGDTFTTLVNSTAHNPQLLQTPEYEPAVHIDNTAYEAANADRFTLDGRTMLVDTPHKLVHYHANVAALLKIAKWFDHLKALGVWDNTRIILVSDHGQDLLQFEDLSIDDGTDPALNVERYYSMLFVKDFNSTGFTVSQEFMTTADVPSLTVEGIIDNPVNPYTGKPLNMAEKTAHPQYIPVSYAYSIMDNNGFSYLPSGWLCVEEDLRNMENWQYYPEKAVLKDHAFPTP